MLDIEGFGWPDDDGVIWAIDEDEVFPIRKPQPMAILQPPPPPPPAVVDHGDGDEEEPFLADVQRVRQQQQRDRQKKTRRRKRTSTPKFGDSSDSDEARERMENKRRRAKRKRAPSKKAGGRRATGSGRKRSSGKSATAAKKKRPRAVPGILPARDDGYAGFGSELVSTKEEGAIAYRSQRDQALTVLEDPEITATTTTTTATDLEVSRTAAVPDQVVRNVDFERTTGTIDGVPIRMPATAILAHFVRNRRVSLEKSRQRVAQDLADQIDSEIMRHGDGDSTTTSGTAAASPPTTTTTTMTAKKKKKKKPKTVLDRSLDEYEEFYLLGRNLLDGINKAMRSAREDEADHPNYAMRTSIAKDLIADQEFRDLTYRNPMANLAMDMLLERRREEGEEDADRSPLEIINSLNLQCLGPGCTRRYCWGFMRGPLWDERPCVNGELCMGMALPLMCPEITSSTKTEACIVLREFLTPDEMSEYHRTGRWPDEEHRRCCILCSRFRITKAFFAYHARGVPPGDCWVQMAQVQDHWNIVGEGEGYSPDETLPVLNPKTGNWELSPYPVVMLNPSNLRAATMEIQPHQGRMIATIEGTKVRMEISVPASHPLHAQHFDDDDDDGGGAMPKEADAPKKYIVGCFVERGQDFRSASATYGQQSL